MTRKSDLRVPKQKKPGVKNKKKVVKPVQAPQVEVMDYITRIETFGSGAPTVPPRRTSEAKRNRTVEILNESGLSQDAAAIQVRTVAQKSKVVYKKGAKKQALSARRDQRQLDAMEAQFNADVAATWGQEPGEYNTLAEAEEAKAAEAAAKAEQEASDKAYEAWYNETAAAEQQKSDEEYKAWAESTLGKSK